MVQRLHQMGGNKMNWYKTLSIHHRGMVEIPIEYVDHLVKAIKEAVPNNIIDEGKQNDRKRIINAEI